MRAYSFPPELPVRVVPFTGFPMGIWKAREVTDWHVVDRRGRTVRVYGQHKDYGEAKRRYRAERYAEALNRRGGYGGV